MGRETLQVTVVDIKMPFLSMVVFMVKWVIAAIPALIILVSFFVVVAMTFGVAGLFKTSYDHYMDKARGIEKQLPTPTFEPSSISKPAVEPTYAPVNLVALHHGELLAIGDTHDKFVRLVSRDEITDQVTWMDTKIPGSLVVRKFVRLEGRKRFIINFARKRANGPYLVSEILEEE